jgi:hypothetical protein
MKKEEKLRTVTVPDGLGRTMAEPDPIVALRERDTGIQHPLDPGQAGFTIGTKAECDVRVDSVYVSKVHCLAERRGPNLSIRDHSSHNGTFIDGARVSGGEIGAGGRLVLAEPAGVSLLAMNRIMVEAVRVFEMILGHDAHHAIDDLLAVAMKPISMKPDGKLDNLAILGEPNCDQDKLIDTIHWVSRRRTMRLIKRTEMPFAYDAQRELVDSANRGTFALAVDENAPAIDNLARVMLFAPEYRVRVLIVAPSAEVAVNVAGVDAFARMHVVQVPPLRQRARDLDRLVDGALAQHGSSLTFAQLTPENQAALRAYRWPGNLPKLHEVAGWLHTLAGTGSQRKASTALGVKRSTFQDWLAEVGLTLPLHREPAR